MERSWRMAIQRLVLRLVLLMYSCAYNDDDDCDFNADGVFMNVHAPQLVPATNNNDNSNNEVGRRVGRRASEQEDEATKCCYSCSNTRDSICSKVVCGLC